MALLQNLMSYFAVWRDLGKKLFVLSKKCANCKGYPTYTSLEQVYFLVLNEIYCKYIYKKKQKKQRLVVSDIMDGFFPLSLLLYILKLLSP